MTVAIDDFAGTGWGVACRGLGIVDKGVEIMPEAIETRENNNLETIYHDVWDGLFHPEKTPPHRGRIGSPPCQTFSVAGSGSGRRALVTVLEAISNRDYESAQRLFELGQRTDPRTALILTPLAAVYRDRPEWVALEQVGPALPVWQGVASVLESLGYSTWVGILNSHDYGVAQTRRRSVLIASRVREVAKPADAGIKLSISDVLPDLPEEYFYLESNYSTSVNGGKLQPGNKKPRSVRKITEPSTTLTSKAGSMHWLDYAGRRISRLNISQASAIQGYPKGFVFSGSLPKQFLQVGNSVPPPMARAILKEAAGLIS